MESGEGEKAGKRETSRERRIQSVCKVVGPLDDTCWTQLAHLAGFNSTFLFNSQDSPLCTVSGKSKFQKGAAGVLYPDYNC